MTVTVDDLVVDALAVYRLTRLVVNDTITRPFRVAIFRHAYDAHDRTDVEQAAMLDDQRPWPVELVMCRWCVGIHAGIAAVIARKVAPRAWSPVARALAFGAVAGLARGLERD